MPVPAMKGARSIVVAVLSGTSMLAGCAVGATSVGGGGGGGGGGGVPAATIVITSVCVAVPAAFVARITAPKTPVAVGTPLIVPVPVSTRTPGGNPVAAKIVGALVALIW